MLRVSQDCLEGVSRVEFLSGAQGFQTPVTVGRLRFPEVVEWWSHSVADCLPAGNATR